MHAKREVSPSQITLSEHISSGRNAFEGQAIEPVPTTYSTTCKMEPKDETLPVLSCMPKVFDENDGELNDAVEGLRECFPDLIHDLFEECQAQGLNRQQFRELFLSTFKKEFGDAFICDLIDFINLLYGTKLSEPAEDLFSKIINSTFDQFSHLLDGCFDMFDNCDKGLVDKRAVATMASLFHLTTSTFPVIGLYIYFSLQSPSLASLTPLQFDFFAS